MDKGLTVPNWVLINRPKITQNLFAQKFGISMKKSLHWASVVCALKYSFRKTIDCCYEKKVVAKSKEGEVLNSNLIFFPIRGIYPPNFNFVKQNNFEGLASGQRAKKVLIITDSDSMYYICCCLLISTHLKFNKTFTNYFGLADC